MYPNRIVSVNTTFTIPIIMKLILWQLEVNLLACSEHIGIHLDMIIKSLNFLAHRNLA